MRHAKSDWTNPLQKDFDRTLNERGLRNAPMMGKRFAEQKINLDLIIASTAKRTEQTAVLIANAIHFDLKKIEWKDELYHASPEIIEEIIISTNDKINSLMIVCHNPGITHFVNSLCGSITANMPTCGIAAFTLQCNSWTEFHTAKKELLFFDFPKKEN